MYELPEGQWTFPYHYPHGVDEWLHVERDALGVRVPLSDKLGVQPPDGGPDRLDFRRRDAVDYWDGECARHGGP
jgi:hypothetical protein